MLQLIPTVLPERQEGIAEKAESQNQTQALTESNFSVRKPYRSPFISGIRTSIISWQSAGHP